MECKKYDFVVIRWNFFYMLLTITLTHSEQSKTIWRKYGDILQLFLSLLEFPDFHSKAKNSAIKLSLNCSLCVCVIVGHM